MSVKNLIVKNLKNNDINALEKVYKQYYSKVYNFANKLNTCSHILADDLVQQTFLRLWEKRHLLKEDVLFEKQLFVISKHIMLNHLKKEKNNISFDDQFTKELFENDIQVFDTIKENRLSLLYAKVKELPQKRRQIFELHKIEGLTYEEISVKLNISIHTVASHLQLATNYLKSECNK